MKILGATVTISAILAVVSFAITAGVQLALALF